MASVPIMTTVDELWPDVSAQSPRIAAPYRSSALEDVVITAILNYLLSVLPLECSPSHTQLAQIF